ncbi:MAG: sensor histidine kinase [Thermoplasmatota archaeon]
MARIVDAVTLAGDAVQAVFLFLFLYALVDYALHRDRPRFDIALMFGSFALVVAASLAANALGARAPRLLTALTSVGLIAQPYTTLRLVDHFRAVPRALRWTALGAMVAGIALVLVYVPTLPGWLAVAIVLYIVVVDGYVASKFIGGAFSARGVTRKRLQLAASATVLFAFLIALIGLFVVAPSLTSIVLVTLAPVEVAAGFAYYFAFAPPRPLRRMWQSEVLLAFMRETGGLAVGVRGGQAMERLIEAANEVVGGDGAFAILRGADGTERVVGAIGLPAGFHPALDEGKGLAARVWKARVATVGSASDYGPLERTLAPREGADALLVVPLATPERTRGVLLVYRRVEPLFPEDDLELVELLAEQATLTLISAEYAEELEARAAELARSNADLEQFAYVASHDLREPLRMVTSYVELLRSRYEGKLGGEADEFIGYAVEGARRMQNLIGDLLAYSRVGATEETFGPTDLGRIVSEAVANLEESIRATGAKVSWDELPVVRAEPTLLVQLFQNLLANAVKFHGAEAPVVRVSATREADAWVVSVKDNGIGIDPKYQDKIFVIFQRLNRREDYDGTGIGLAIAKRIVERHGGRIWVESRVGHGAEFKFTLPAGGVA